MIRRNRRPTGLALDPMWRTAVVCASGPSFSEEQAAFIIEARQRDRCRVLVVSDNYRRVPNADALLSADTGWWLHHIAAVRALPFRGSCWTLNRNAAHRFGLHPLAVEQRPGLTDRHKVIRQGGNSGYHAINLAFLFGAHRMILVGFDMRASDGVQHWFGEHPPRLRTELPFARWIKAFGPLADDLRAEGVDVVNVSPDSALTHFPKATLADALA